MTHAYSLYARITLTAQHFELMMNSSISKGSDYKDWQAWFEKGNTNWDVQVPERVLGGVDGLDTLRQLIQIACDDPLCGAKSQFDSLHGVWRFCILNLTASYGEMVLLLAALRGCASFNNFKADDFILIYPFLSNEPGCLACIELSGGKSLFVNDPLRAQTREADKFLAQVYSNFKPEWHKQVV